MQFKFLFYINFILLSAKHFFVLNYIIQKLKVTFFVFQQPQYYQTKPSLILDDSEKLPVDMNSGEPGRSDVFGLAPATGGFGWFRKLASGVIPLKSFTIGIEPGWSKGPNLK